MINNAFILDFSILAEQNLSIEEFITIIHLKEGIIYSFRSQDGQFYPEESVRCWFCD